MKCTNCNTENNESANFCKNCGTNLNITLSVETTNSNLSDKLLLIYLCIAIFTFVYFTAIEILDIIPKEYMIIRDSLWIISDLSMILIPLSIKNKNLKIIGLIFTAIIVLYRTYKSIVFMM